MVLPLVVALVGLVTPQLVAPVDKGRKPSHIVPVVVVVTVLYLHLSVVLAVLIMPTPKADVAVVVWCTKHLTPPLVAEVRHSDQALIYRPVSVARIPTALKPQQMRLARWGL